MSDIKCPFCQQELEQITTSNPLGLGRIEMAVCKKCMDKGVLHIMPIWDWQELIRTCKTLEQSEICCTEWEKQALDYKAENIALSGDLERTRKALDVAVDKLKGIKAYYDDSYADPHFVNWHIVAQRLANDADDAIKAITALEQKDVK